MYFFIATLESSGLLLTTMHYMYNSIWKQIEVYLLRCCQFIHNL